MAILEIKKYPESVLKKRTEDIEEITEATKRLVFDMIETLKESQGIGLAAPQVGVAKRIAIIRPVEERTQAEKDEKDFLVIINPKIVKKSKEKKVSEEGCLSLPGFYLNIKRPRAVEVEALDITGKKINIKAEGLPARIFQHEIDHLDGVLIIDRINFFERLKFLIKIRQAH